LIAINIPMQNQDGDAKPYLDSGVIT